MKIDINGIFSLLIFCIELAFFINVLFITVRNRLNLYVIGIIFLLMMYQLSEFVICNLHPNKNTLLIFPIAVISLLPPLSTLFIFEFTGKKILNAYLIFIPYVLFIIFYSMNLESFSILSCSPIYISFNYPLGDLYGIFYYAPIVFSLYLLFNKYKNDEYRKKTVIIMKGYLFSFLPGMILFPFITNVIESILCKFAFFLALYLTIFSLNNRNQNN